MALFTQEQWLPAPLEQVFLFFSDPNNLLRLTPAENRARFTHVQLVPPPGGSPTLAGVGSEITVSVRPLAWLPFRQKWTAKIVEFEWNDHFRDLQIAGPMRLFDHTHSFAAESRGSVAGTLMKDRIEYRTGWGAPADGFARRQLESLFAYRRAELEKLFPSK